MRNRIARWLVVCVVVLAFILVPWLLWGKQIESWTEGLLQAASQQAGWIAAVLALLLGADIVLPVPSSVISTTLGYLVGFVGGCLASWAAMTASSVIGYWLAWSGRPVVRRLVGEKDLSRLETMSRRFGKWVIVACRPLPMLAEASVLFAGMGRMPLLQFLAMSALSNLGISAVYAAVGAYSATVNSFLLAFAGAILVPLAAMLALGMYKEEQPTAE